MSLEQTRTFSGATAASPRSRQLVLPRFTRRAFAVWLHEFYSWRRYYRSSILLNFGEPILNLVALGWGLGAYIANMGDQSFLEFIGPGLLAVTAMNSVTYDTCYEGFDRLNRTGIYTAMTSTSLDAAEVVGGHVLWEVTRSLLYGGIFFTVLLLFGLVQSITGFLVFLPLILSGTLFSLAGLVVVAKAKSYEHLFYYFSLVITPMFLFSGVFFPIERLPGVLQWVAHAVPLYHLVELNRALIGGQIDAALLVHVVMLLTMIGVLALFPAKLLRRALEHL